tara:strand:+ start:2297 stop:2503 length:207 start_codon:yes stop_codon:yes gene_type:complete
VVVAMEVTRMAAAAAAAVVTAAAAAVVTAAAAVVMMEVPMTAGTEVAVPTIVVGSAVLGTRCTERSRH